MMFILRMLPIMLFSVTALSLLTYQGIEIFHAFTDYFQKK